MAKPEISQKDAEFKTLKSIKDSATLSDSVVKDFAHAAGEFVTNNVSDCLDIPRQWKKDHWKRVARRFAEDQGNGEKFFTARRNQFDPDTDLAWPADKDDILFLCFAMIRFECKRLAPGNKRDNDGDETETPAKKKKAATPASTVSSNKGKVSKKASTPVQSHNTTEESDEEDEDMTEDDGSDEEIATSNKTKDVLSSPALAKQGKDTTSNGTDTIKEPEATRSNTFRAINSADSYSKEINEFPDLIHLSPQDLSEKGKADTEHHPMLPANHESIKTNGQDVAMAEEHTPTNINDIDFPVIFNCGYKDCKSTLMVSLPGSVHFNDFLKYVHDRKDDDVKKILSANDSATVIRVRGSGMNVWHGFNLDNPHAPQMWTEAVKMALRASRDTPDLIAVVNVALDGNPFG